MFNPLRILIPVGAFACLWLSALLPAHAQDITVTQGNKQFSESEVRIEEGSSILFVNDDSVAHNVYYMLDGDRVDLGLQAPGAEDPLEFSESGTFEIRCAIHPRMRMTVIVE